jgi:hypothetical protein
MKRHAKAVLILIALFAGSMALFAQDQQKPAPKPEVNLPNWYKVEITLNEFENGKKTNTRSYTLEAEANGPRSEMKLGDRVPVSTGSGGQFQYMDMGLNISSFVTERYERIGLFVSVEQSNFTFPGQGEHSVPNIPVIRQLRMENRTYVTLGKPTLIASVDDPERTNHKYTVEATVTKLNP